jgi:hypothetical protein
LIVPFAMVLVLSLPYGDSVLWEVLADPGMCLPASATVALP